MIYIIFAAAPLLAGHVMYVAAFVTLGVAGPLVWTAALIGLI